MINLTESFVDYLINKSKDVNDAILEKAKDCLFDYYAVVYAGAERTNSKWNGFLEHSDAGAAELFGYNRCTDGRTAAFVNGFNAHCLEMDDGQRFAMIHLGSPVISALLSARAECNITAKDLLTGIIMGYEAACRTAIAMQPSHKQMGYHASGTCGTIGAAAGIAFALGMGRMQIKRVLSCAAGSAAGMLEIQEQNSQIKPYNLGRAAMDGVNAAYMGLTKYNVPDDMLGGERGYYRLFAEESDVSKLIEQHDYFEIERIYRKLYASCRHSHAAVEAAIALSHETDCSKIERILIETYSLGVKGHDHNDILSTASAMLSTPYAVSAALLYGKCDISSFDPLDQKACELAKKVSLVEIPELSANAASARTAVLHVYTEDHMELCKRIDFAKGEPENPVVREELLAKAIGLLGAEKGNKLFESVFGDDR